MSGNSGEEAPRPRPLSGPVRLWTLFSWLRREERVSSSDSISSAGSDRTALSFSFLPPINYSNGVKPLVVPPPGPPTDSYRKRVQDRNLRRQHDRNITLHRKYGLYRSDCTNGYDAFSLPTARRVNADPNSKWDRERRATSECLQGRVLHVPGKRRAPQPPTRSASVGPTATFTRRTRKRPAPPPPVKPLPKIEETVNINENKSLTMNPQTSQSQQLSKNNDVFMGCKPEKYSKKDNNTKESKSRSEKNFIKQIFENRKRHSTSETTSVKVLPSISELDKQAAEIIKTNKQNSAKECDNTTLLNLSITKSQGSMSSSSKEEYWFCIVCLRKYDCSITDCLYCSHKQQSSSKIVEPLLERPSSIRVTQQCKVEDKQKLKEMLKEMKDSLPKRTKHGLIDVNKSKNNNINITEVGDKDYNGFETPTLRIGATITPLKNSAQLSKDNESVPKESLHVEVKPSLSNVLITKTIIIEPSGSKPTCSTENTKISKFTSGLPQTDRINKTSYNVHVNTSILGTPLKISSLLNPIYIPKEDNNVEANPCASSLSNRKLNKIEENPTKFTENVQLLDKPHSMSAAFTSNSTNKVGQVNSKQNHQIKDLPNKQLNFISEKNVKNDQESLFKKDSIVNDELNNSGVPGIVLTSSNKKETFNNTNNISTTSNLLIRESDTALSKPNINDLNSSNNKISHNTELKRDIVPPTIVENSKTSNTTTEAIKQFTGKKSSVDTKPTISILKTELDVTPSSSKNVDSIDHHSQRRSLISQLEQSIAKGNEHAAAEAAAKLAQLRLSCSVLSFSSQIISEPTTSTDKLKNSVYLNISSLQPKIEVNLQKTNRYIDPSTSTAHTPSEINKAVATNTAAKIVETDKTSQPTTSTQQSDIVSIKVWVEDKEAARGPIHLRVDKKATIGNLRNEAEASLGLARHLQRWIVGRTLCTDDNALLTSLTGADFNAPVYLCLVESDSNKNKLPDKTEDSTETKVSDLTKAYKAESLANVYKELVQLELQALVPNAELFECGICMEESAPGAGAVLRDCVHMFCKQCLSDLVLHCEEPIISCPAMGCHGVLEEREIRALVSPEEYERWLARGLNAAESGTRNAFHCRTRDCTGWALCEPGVRRFPCPVCNHTNCVPCQAIHEQQTCKEFQAILKEAANRPQANQSDDDTRALLNTLIKRGEALECPECKAIITKKWGCDWIKCSACKTEICWVTRGRRWGPAGRGDTSAGCRCGVDGKRCHPSCGYCH